MSLQADFWKSFEKSIVQAYHVPQKNFENEEKTFF